jgi:hypothetical protein
MILSVTGIRNYQIIYKSEKKDDKDSHLVEIGPRMVLIPIRIFAGSFGGATLYQNLGFVSPNEDRSNKKKLKGYVHSHTSFEIIACNDHSFYSILLVTDIRSVHNTRQN